MKILILSILKDLIFLGLMFLIIKFFLHELKEFEPKSNTIICYQADDGLNCNQ